jgi:hypothetical protein
MNEYDTACDVGDKKPEAKRGRRKRTTGRVRDGVERPGVLCVRTTFRTLAWFQALSRRHGGAGRALEALHRRVSPCAPEGVGEE